MSDFDPCECIWSHEHAMQRLLNLLRNSQSYCTDNNCPENLPGPGEGAPDGGFSSMMLMMMGWLVMATALFLFRPKSLRAQPDQKPANGRDGSGGPDDGPPPPPPAVN